MYTYIYMRYALHSVSVSPCVPPHCTIPPIFACTAAVAFGSLVFRIMTFSIQQAKRFYYRPGSPAARKGPLLRAQGVLMSELLMTPRVRAYIYIYIYKPKYNIIPATHCIYNCTLCPYLHIHNIYLYVCAVFADFTWPRRRRRHHHHHGYRVLQSFSASPPHCAVKTVSRITKAALLIIAVYPIVNPALHRVATVNTYLYLPIYLLIVPI